VPFERPLRILHWTSAWSDIPIAPDCRVAAERAAGLLRDLGHDVVETLPPPLKYDSFIDALVDVMAANVAVTVNGQLRQKPDPAFEQKLEPALLDAYRIGSALAAERYALAITRFHATGRLLSTHMAGHDAILTPTLTQPPLKLGTLSTETDFRSFRRQAGRYTTFLAVFNAAGLPAASLPLHTTAENLPIGVQLAGHFGAEATILRLAAQLERVAPWRDRRPS
jgi:amidase